MKYKMTKTAVSVLMLVVMAGLSQAADQKEKSENQKADATLSLSGGSVAVGIGFSWGKGTLTYKGKRYPVKVDGLSIGKVGITGASASGKVYNLKKLANFNGDYQAGGVGMTIAGGRGKIALRNQNDVQVLLTATTRGLDLTVAGAGVKMEIKKIWPPTEGGNPKSPYVWAAVRYLYIERGIDSPTLGRR